MATLAPKGQVDLAKTRAQELLDTNNAASSRTSDKLLSILEAGEGTSIARDHLDQFLHNLIEAEGHSAAYDWARLRQCLSIKEKIAFITAERYVNATGVVATSTEDIVDLEIRKILEETIRRIEEGLINNRDFTESRILRNAAVNRFECKLTTGEKVKLNNFTGKIKKICTDNKLDTLAESTDFSQESDAQKIMKISDIISQLNGAGIDISQDLVKEFELLDEKIKPLRDLDKHYKHVTKTLNMLHRVAQKGYKSMVTPAQERKVQAVVAKINMTKTVNDALTAYNNKDNFDKNEEHTYLENLLEQVKQNPDFKKALHDNMMSEAEFNERFTVGNVYYMMEAAKKGLDGQKGTAFGARLKDFEADTQSRRGLVRRRLLDIGEHMVGNPPDFAPGTTDFDTANSYFDKFKDLFFAKEEDNYESNPAVREYQQHYDSMRNIVAALVRHRVGVGVSGQRIRRGSAGRIAYHFIENAFSGKERGMKDRIRRTRQHADDATVIAMVIMAQNEATNQVFYQDNNKAQKKDSRFGKLLNKVSFAEEGRKRISTRMKPKTDKALTLVEEAAKKGLGLTQRGAQRTNKIVSKTARGTTRVLDKTTGAYNKMVKDTKFKRWKTPMYLPLVITYPAEKVSQLINKGATYTDAHGNEHIKFAGDQINKGYEQAKDLVGKSTGQETDYLFKGLTYGIEKTTSLGGQGIAAAGKWAHETYTTGQQRSVLGAFYNAAKEQGGLEDLMQSAELGDILNLKERGPYLFDEDGRIVITEKVVKKDEGSPEVAGKVFGEELEKQYKKLTQQIDNDVKKALKESEEAIKTGDDNSKIQANAKITHTQTNRNNINSLGIQINSLNNILKNVMTTGGARRTGDIDAQITLIETAVTGFTGGINIATLNANCTTAFRDLSTHSSEVTRAEETLKNLKIGLSQRGADTAAITTQITAAEVVLNTAITEKTNAMIDYNQRLAELQAAQQRVSFFETIGQVLNKIRDINNRMGTATTDDEKRSIAKELTEFSKNINILLYPEDDDKKTKKIDINSLSKDEREELLKALNTAS